MSDLVSQRPANSVGVLDRNNAGGGTLVGDQAPDLPADATTRAGAPFFLDGAARAQSVIGVRSPLSLCRPAQHDHVSEPGSCGLPMPVIRTGRRSELI